jgi:protein-S-isoprenylcysteine O-methyltransferase Ste14
MHINSAKAHFRLERRGRVPGCGHNDILNPLTLSDMSFITAIATLWILFYSYWLLSAIGVKKAVRATPWRKGVGIRLLLVVAALVLTRLLRLHHMFFRHPTGLLLNIVGIVLCVTGLAFAVWARVNLGRNWGTPMSLKEGHELVTTGPYQYVWHPIYTGILLAVLGTAFVVGMFWLLIFLIVCLFFIYSARTEERLMMKAFPDTYPEYKKRTRALVPFVW